MFAGLGVVGISAQEPMRSSAQRIQQQLASVLEKTGISVGNDAVMSSGSDKPFFEVLVRLDATVAPPPSSSNSAGSSSGAGWRSPHQVLRRTRHSSGAPLPRSLELGEGRLLVVVTDKSSQLRSWSVIPDPRFLRSEGPGPDGVLTGQIVQVSVPTFSIQVPDDPSATEVRIFAPARGAGGANTPPPPPGSASTGSAVELVAILPAQ